MALTSKTIEEQIAHALDAQEATVHEIEQKHMEAVNELRRLQKLFDAIDHTDPDDYPGRE